MNVKMFALERGTVISVHAIIYRRITVYLSVDQMCSEDL